MEGPTTSDMTSPEHLSELERFAEIGRLSASLLHEISNPLTSALIWLERCSAKQSPYISHVSASVRLLQRYVEAARQQVRRESRSGHFYVRSELEQVRHVLSALAATRGVSLRFEQPRGCKMYGDPVKFQQIIANLLRNAIDAYDSRPAGGYKPVRLRLRVGRDFLVIEVSDRGCGIAEDQLEHIFRPFYSTKAADGMGLGIGLFAVKRSIEDDFGGSIRVVSSSRRGTKFTARLRIGSVRAKAPSHGSVSIL